MEYKNTRYAVVKSPNPEAALYFEHAYCLEGNVSGSMTTASDIFSIQKPTVIENFILSPDETINTDHWSAKKMITQDALEIVRRNFHSNDFTDKFLADIEKSILKYGENVYGTKKELIEDFININANESAESFNPELFLDNLMITATTIYYKKKGLYVVPVLEEVDSPNWIRGNNLEDGIELSLLDLPLVQNKNIEWEQVKEIRDDKSSIDKLRNLRLFLDGLDINKGKDYVQDILLRKVEDYEISAKKHGFKLGKGPLKAMLSMKHIPKLLSYGVCALLNPALTTVGAVLSVAEIGGAVKEVGDISIALKEQKVMKKLDGVHKDIEYLVSIKNKIKEA